MVQKKPKVWAPCLADQFLGVSFFDGIRIDTDRITDPRWDRVLPILPEEQVLMCRLMLERGLLHPGVSVLDVGTGSGVFAIWAAAHGCKVTAVENSPRALKFARHNREIPENATKLAMSGGSVEFIAADFLSWARGQQERFDLVILAPPYNPTAPRVLPACHAEAGPLGQERFHEQLPLAHDLVGDGGRIVGNQMVYHQPGLIGEWWRDVAGSLVPSILSECSVVFTSILDPPEYSAKAFLEAQYRFFLDPGLSPEMAPVVDRYIRESLEKAGQNGVFGLYYYEISVTPGHSHAPGQCASFDLPFPSPAGWPERIELHRRIVEHTSTKSSIPSAALFLHNDFTPPLPNAPADRMLKAAVGSSPSFDASVLKTVLTWILQNRLLDAEVAIFDLLLVDIGPWFYTERGRDSIQNEAILCGCSELRDSVVHLLSSYQRNTKAQQLCRLAPFLHPSFTGASDPAEWGGVNFHAVDDVEVGFGLTDADVNRLDAWTSEVSAKFFELGRQLTDDDPHIEQVPAPIGAAYASSSLKSLGVPQPKAYISRIEGDWGADESSNTEIQRRDLELVHAMFHRRLRDILKPKGVRTFSSALLGMPIAMAFSGLTSEGSDLPDNYRGGLWIYAAGKQRIGPRQESMIWDIARLAALTASASINAAATTSLIRVVRERGNISMGAQGEAWTRFSETAEGLFPVGDYHTAKAWLDRLAKKKLPSEKKAALDLACGTFFSELNIDATMFEFEELVSLARSASRGYCVSVPFLSRMLGQKLVFKGRFPAIRCTAPGQIVAALHYFMYCKPEEVQSVQVRITPPKPKSSVGAPVLIDLMATYSTLEEANRAAEILAKAPVDRQIDEHRTTPGEACSYSYWLRREAKHYGPPQCIERTLTMWWEYACDWPE